MSNKNMKNICEIMGKNSGAVLIELIVSLAVFMIIVAGVFSTLLGSLRDTVDNKSQTEGHFLAQEGIEAVKSIRDNDWLDLADGTHGLTDGSGYWDFQGVSETIGDYTRSITIEGVNRDVSGDIVTSGGSLDPRTKKITTTIDWIGIASAQSIITESYLTDWNVFDWFETSDADFGAGSMTNVQVVGAGDAASLSLDFQPNWINASGSSFTHTSDTDFAGGTFVNSEVVGLGTPADIELTNSGVFIWDEISSPVGNNLYGIHMVSEDDGWIVGNNGTILRFDGSNWSEVSSPTNSRLNAVEMVSATDGWIVGDAGKIFRWDGNNWTEFTDTGSTNWAGIHMVSATDGWAVGGGKIIHFDGTSWTDFATLGSGWNDVFMVSATDGWAVGTGGDIAHYDGVGWTLAVSPGSENLKGVHMVSSSDGWAVGNNGNILRWDGVNWSLFVDTGGTHWQGIYIVSASEGWAVGSSGEIEHWDGTSWTTHTATGNQWDAVFMVSSSDGWAVGNGGSIQHYVDKYQSSGTFESVVFDSGEVGSIWNSMSWSETLPTDTDITIAVRTGPTAIPDGGWSDWSSEYSDPSLEMIGPPDNQYFQYRITLTTSDYGETPEFHDITVIYDKITSENLNDVHMVLSNNGWAVGSNGVILHWDGTNWSLHSDVGDTHLNAISSISTNNVWAVGDSGKIFNWNGIAWAEFIDMGDMALYDIEMVASNDGWVVGEGGTVVRWDGLSMAATASLGNKNLNSIHMLSASEGWVVGESGTAFYWDGVIWAENKDMNKSLLDVHMVTTNDGWIIDYDETIYHWDGVSWTAFVDFDVEDLHSIFVVSSNEGWIVGQSGKTYYWNGSNWSEYGYVGSENLNSVFMVSSYDGWAVGDIGTIYYFGNNSTYASSGTFLSSILNTDKVTTSFQSLFWSESLPSGTDITIATRSGNTSTPDGSWSAWSSEVLDANGSANDAPDARYLQYRATLTTSDGAVTPALEDITLTYK